MFGTLRARLTLWNTAVVLVLVALPLVGAREGLRQILVSGLDEFLEEEMADIKEEVYERSSKGEDISTWLNTKALNHPRRRLFVQLFSPSGDLLWSSAHTPREEWTQRFQSGTAGAPVVCGEYRMLRQPLDAPRLVIRIGVSTQRASRDLADFTYAVLVIGGIVLVLTPGAGYLLAGRATHPVSRLIDTAARLHPARLGERLPLSGTNDELDRLSETINGLLDRIARYLEQNRKFNANAAHELRTPLAAIRSALEVLLLRDRTADEYKEGTLVLLDEIDQLRGLVNKLLLLAEGDAGQLCPVREPTRLDRIVQTAADMFSAAAEAKGVDLYVGRLDAVTLVADPTALRQVVNNLLDNAIKYTAAGGRVVAEVKCEELSGECALRVRDNGIGITAGDLPNIFQRFYRADKSRARDRVRRGSGLGLSICQAIVEAHAGTIRLESAPGAGTAVTVRLPANDVPC
ncbi:Two-component system sensor histidine kinase [Frigoriglobus tundricola]|uniref:histidine kinase n=1 Tax=Frigoriglobus tundricola TaxID=2774151 RepID=A0A6M5Z3K1_9BACT|nr:Two-component system sensor histidine kinase [Frigoriglobus tundricola]